MKRNLFKFSMRSWALSLLFFVGPVVCFASEDIREVQIEDLEIDRIALENLIKGLKEPELEKILKNILAMPQGAEDKRYRTLTTEEVPKDFPAAFLLNPENRVALIQKLHDLAKWHSDLREVPGTPDRSREPDYETMRAYYPTFNLEWNRTWLRLMTDLPSSFVAKFFKKSLAAQRYSKANFQTPSKHLDTSKFLVPAALKLMERPEWRGFFMSYRFHDIVELEEAMRDHIKESMRDLRQSEPLPNCPPGTSLDELYEIFSEDKTNMKMPASELAKSRPFSRSLLSRASRDAENSPFDEFLLTIVANGPTSELGGLIFLAATARAKKMEDRLKFSEPQSANGISALTLKNLQGALKDWVEKMSQEAFLTRGENPTPLPIDPDKAQLLYEYLDYWREMEDPYYHQYQETRRFHWLVEDIKAEATKEGIDWSDLSKNDPRRRFLDSVGVQLPNPMDVPAPWSLKQDLSQMFPPLDTQGKSAACVTFGICADMSVVLRQQTGLNLVVDPWAAHSLVRMHDLVSRGDRDKYKLEFEHEILPLKEKPNLPNNPASFWTAEQFLNSGARPMDVITTLSEISTQVVTEGSDQHQPRKVAEDWPATMNDYTNRRYRIESVAALEPGSYMRANGIGIDEGFFKLLIDNRIPVAIGNRTDKAKVQGDWMILTPKSPSDSFVGGHFINVVGYGSEMNPFTFQVSRYILVRDSLAGEGKQYRKVPAQNFMNYLSSVYKVTKVAEEPISTPLLDATVNPEPNYRR